MPLGLQSRPHEPSIRRAREIEGGALVRAGVLAAAMLALAACGDSSATPPTSDPTASAAILKKDCADPKWREENLGLWYSVCRQPLRW